MKVTHLAIPEVFLVESVAHRDARGAFSETFRASVLAEAGAPRPFVQENLASTTGASVLRGLHFQREPHAQDKLVQVVAGAIFDVAVDVRPGSPTLGRWVSVTLNADQPRALYVPRGFAHGYMTLTASCAVLYKTTAYYAPEAEAGVRWDDPTIAIDWPALPEEINARDRAWPLFAEAVAALAE
jgi:dTDP-4-dehydrorhamnose 3,5-epimerase